MRRYETGDCGSSIVRFRCSKRKMFSENMRVLNGITLIELLCWLLISVYLSSLPVSHLSDAPGRLLVVAGDSARIQDETTENSVWFFNVLGV